ncbi:hypothetical protein WCWAEYFT_CDS0142 [Vibrio phage VB_VaC_TDDLMA]
MIIVYEAFLDESEEQFLEFRIYDTTNPKLITKYYCRSLESMVKHEDVMITRSPTVEIYNHMVELGRYPDMYSFKTNIKKDLAEYFI